MPTLSTCTDQDEANAILAAFETGIRSANAAVASYKALWQDPTIPAEDQANYKAAYLEASNDATLLSSRYSAFVNDSPLGDIAAPTDADVTRLQANTASLQAIVVSNENGATILALIQETLAILATT